MNIEDNNLIANYHLKSEEVFWNKLENWRTIKKQEIKIKEASKKPYGELVKGNVQTLERFDGKREFKNLMKTIFYDSDYNPFFHGLNLEDVSKFLRPMSDNVSEPIGSMGDILLLISQKVESFMTTLSSNLHR